MSDLPLFPESEDPTREIVRCGIDESGMGTLFGILCIAIIANPANIHFSGVQDSKTVTKRAARDRITTIIKDQLVWSYRLVSAFEIDSYGVRQMHHKRTRELAITLMKQPLFRQKRCHFQVVVDGDGHEPMDQYFGAQNRHRITIVCKAKADATVFECSAASLVAKTTHDDWISKAIVHDPSLDRYDMANSLGYGTPKHIAGLLQHGLHRLHRKVACETAMRHARHKMQGQSHLTPLFAVRSI